jgi:hypothetical protein
VSPCIVPSIAAPPCRNSAEGGRGHLGRGQPRLTFETLQAAYSQPTFRNPLWAKRFAKRLTPTDLSGGASAHQPRCCTPQDGSTAVASKPKCSVLAPGDCGESGCRGREKVRHD